MSRILLCTFLLFGLFHVALVAQGSINEGFTILDAPPKAMNMYSKLQKSAYQKDQSKRLKYLDKILAKFPEFIDVHTEKAFSLYQQGNTAVARESMERSIMLKQDYQPKRYLILANYCKELQDLDCEETRLREFLQRDPSSKFKEKIQARIEDLGVRKTLAAKYSSLDIIKLDATINTEDYAEYKPVLSIDGQEMIFTRRINGQEDFYRSRISNSSTWNEAEPVTELNTPGNEGAHAISLDGKFLIFTKCDAPKRYKSCDLYISQRKGEFWSEPQYMSNINTEAWESQAAFSPDGQTIYFSSGRSGNRDLYSISRIDGKWQDVVSLSKVINTTGSEESPYLHPDGRTLYFMSNGHPGLGGMDLFVSKMQFDGSWSTPVNMGGSINSSADEGGLYVDVQGEYAYFSKTQKTEKGIDSDIYRFKLPQDFRPDPVTYLQLIVKDGLTGESIAADVQLKQIGEQSTRRFKVNEEGKVVVVSQEKAYSLLVQKEAYVFHSERIENQTHSDRSEPIIYQIELYPLEATAVQDTTPPISLRNILFEVGSSDLLPESNEELDRLVTLLGANPLKNIILNGHTDNVGNPQDNVILSQKRAAAVQAYLIQAGVAANRITTKAYGESQPIASNETSDGRAQNRRIEFQLINPS